MTEEQLAIRAGAGDHEAFAELARRMHGLVRSIAARYYAPGLDHADLLALTPLEREALIGFVFNGESYLDVEARIIAFDGARPGRAAYGPVKVIDNALSRARSKIRLALAEDPDRLPLGAAA